MKYTNLYIVSNKHMFQREPDVSSNNILELRAFFGLLYFIASQKYCRKYLYKLWDNSKYVSMSVKAFSFQVRCIRFHDIRRKDSRKAFDKFIATGVIFELFVDN